MIRIARVCDALLIPLVPLALALAFLCAPREATMGDAQRIFYFHVPFALHSFLAFGIVLFASVGYLVKRRPDLDAAGHAAVEVGWVFCTLVLLTGPVWAKYAWAFSTMAARL